MICRLIGSGVLAIVIAAAVPAYAQSVVAVPEAATADAGVASKPIANVAANDTVNGVPAVLGASGNATVAQDGSWPAGITLNVLTGAVTTKIALAPGSYDISYLLCDTSTPPNCTTALDNVTVITASVAPVAETGTADAGIASRPIANVAANDTINGLQAILGASGNGTVAQVGSWPPGVALTPSTGAISTTVAVIPGSYAVAYQLCDRNVPASCSVAIDTVNVIASTISPVPDLGNADTGIASRPIANVAANDTVNGSPAVLGSGGNASVAQAGVWPAGIALTPSTGAVSTTVAVPAGSYAVSYRLCDRNVPANCATALDTVNVIAATINAVPDSGTADAGLASRPIANVAANDTVNGVPAVLGTLGNASVAQFGAWPAGIALTPSTGAVSTTVAVAPGTYSMIYQLCDRNSPKICSTAVDSVTVVTALLDPEPDTGTAIAGVASTAIPNVTSNDFINGVPVVLGSSGNATVATFGVWPIGIAFTASTGAVNVSASALPGIYSVSYQLCDRNTPVNCAITTDTVSVAASIMPVPVAGSAFVGRNMTAIANVTIKDRVNNAPANIGFSGNATIAQFGAWPDGIMLNTATGAVTTSASVPAGTYALQTQLCDRALPPNCATTTDNLIVTPAFTEVQASATVLGDIEFDWGRDGISCPGCNNGEGNSRFNWTDRNNNLWVSHVDRTTGLFVPAAGHQQLVDTTAFFWQDWGNGPEWAFSMQNGQVVSQLVYTRYVPGAPATYSNAGAAVATEANGVWTPSFLPGAISPGNNTILPAASQCLTDPVALSVFVNLDNPSQAFTEPVSTDPATVPQLTSFGSFSNKIGERWVPCTHWMTFQGNVTIGANTLQQVFWYDVDSQTVQQLTFDPTTKQRAVMFKAPEFLGTPYPYAMVMLAADTQIQVYQQTGVGDNGAPVFALYNTIYSSDPVQPYMFDPKMFIHCNPACHTYVVVGMTQTVNAQFVETKPTGLALMNIDRDNPMFKVLVPAATLPLQQRLDPEYFITANGPYVYYADLLVHTTTQPYQIQGFYFIDMGLGPPSGPCVGSSAESGLAGPVGVCQ